MAKKESERLPRPALPPPLNVPSGGKIKLIVTGKVDVKSTDPNVEIERKD